jgi:nicotinate phosphoribosyltransferase
MILKHFTDNDLYKFTTMNAIQKLYPKALVRYEFINRGTTSFPEGFAARLATEVRSLAGVCLTREEEEFIISKCYYFDPVFIDLLKGYRYDPGEVTIEQSGEDLSIVIEGLWYRTVLWEVPLLALVSELFYITRGDMPSEVVERARDKAVRLKELKASYSDFGTRRRFSHDVHDLVLKTLKEHSGYWFRGTSNVYLAMKHNLLPLGTHPHEWFMFHGAEFGYRTANQRALDAWVEVYKGDLGTALTDTYTTDNFFASFSTLHAKLFDGLRHDSGDPLIFTDRAIDFYRKNRADPSTKTIVFSDALDIEKIERIKQYAGGRINDVYGIGTYLSNDTGLKPLNMVIKMTGSKMRPGDPWHTAIKLSDDPAKHVGDRDEIEICKKVLGL